jgi:predicted phage-related endonuclease
MALSEEHQKRRREFVGGSDANIILSGDEEKILRLWREKRGEAESEDLDNVLQVQMGTFTEPLNAIWFTKQTGRSIANQGEIRVSNDYPFMGCTLDGLTDEGKTIWEAKHVSAFSKEEEILDRYMPQLHHNMIVCGLSSSVLSVFYGNHKWEKYEVSYDPLYGAALIEAVKHFWGCVKSGKAPVLVKVHAPIEPVRRVDMTSNNRWAVLSAQYIENAKYNKIFDEAAKELKGMIEEDVMEASGHGVTVRRDKRGALRIKGV